MVDVLKKFGRYFLFDRLAQGGMAEIYRARMASMDAAGRLMVIKRIQPNFGANVEFLQMFRSEIKVMMGFSHPNIVQLYDFGEEADQPYISMEFVDGKTLRQFVSRLGEKKQKFPIEMSAYIVEQIACGLHYAHAFKDKITGQPLNIIHRDVSPQNIMISFEGGVKVIDFGIAKAAVNSEATRAGVIKGKPGYLSPEQIASDTLDGRSDVFSVGAVFWELLTGRKLFAGENDLAILKMIESCQSHVKPPSKYNSKVPKELDQIVLKALAQDKEKRYQTAEEMQRALHKFVYGYFPEFNPSDLAYYAKDLFRDEIVEDRKRIQKLNEKVEQLLALDVSAAQNLEGDVFRLPGDESEADSTTTVVELAKKSTGSREVFDPDGSAGAKVEIDVKRASVTDGKPARLEPPAPTNTPHGDMRGEPRGDEDGFRNQSAYQPPYPFPPKQKLESNRRKKGKSPGRSLFVGIAAAIAVLLLVSEDTGWIKGRLGTGPGKDPRVNGAAPDNRVPSSVNQKPPVIANSEKGGSTILLKLNLISESVLTYVSINGKPLDMKRPAAQVPLDAPLELVVTKENGSIFKREFVVDSRQVSGLGEYAMDVSLEARKYGLVTIRSNPPADAIMMMDGKRWTKRTPIENESIPIGTYDIKLVNDLLGMEKKLSVTVQEGKITTKDVKLDVLN